MSWLRVGLVLALASTAAAGSACTAITLAQWNGYSALDDGGGADGSNVGAQSACNPAYLKGISACGSCMESNCSSYIKLACGIDAGSPYSTGWVDDNVLPCAQNTDVNSGNCDFFTRSADASISGLSDPPALESNVQVCLKSYCFDDCRSCKITYSGCQGSPVTVGPDSPCGNCIVTKCQTPLADCCAKNDLDEAPITACSKTANTCTGAGSCALLASYAQDAGSESTCSLAAFSCITSNCSSVCPQ